jgi:photosystem II stability/assembly factor-like uncharacterized protein
LFLARLSGEVRSLGLSGLGGFRSPVLADVDYPDRLYAPTVGEGVWLSTDGGKSWEERNRGLTYKEVWSLVQHPQTGVLLAGTGPAAIFASHDRGQTWSEYAALRALPSSREWTFPGPPYCSHVKGLCVQGDDGRHIMGAIEEGWLVQSLDGGASWENLQDGCEFDSHGVRVMPDDPNVIVAFAGTGIYKSRNRGKSFEPSFEGLDRRYMSGLAVHPGAPQRLFAAATELPPPGWRRPEGASTGFYVSHDQADSWTRVTEGLPGYFTAGARAVAGHPTDPDRYFVGLSDGTLWTSDDGAVSFHKVLDGLPPVSSIGVLGQ